MKRALCWTVMVLAVGAFASVAQADSTTGSVTVSTDSSWTVDGSGSAAIVRPDCLPGYGGWGWTASIAGSWIWANECSATDTEQHTFATTVTLPADATVTSASLAFAADNFGVASINGSTVIDETGDGGYNFRDWQSADATSFVHGGTNTVSLDVWNMSNDSPEGWGNPAGAVASLTVNYQQCDPAAPAIATDYLLRTVGMKASSTKFKTIVNTIAQNLANGKYGRNPCEAGYRAMVLTDVTAGL